MPTKKEKTKEAFQIPPKIGDKEIRSIRAAAMGVSMYEYEKTLKAIGLDEFD